MISILSSALQNKVKLYLIWLGLSLAYHRLINREHAEFKLNTYNNSLLKQLCISICASLGPKNNKEKKINQVQF